MIVAPGHRLMTEVARQGAHLWTVPERPADPRGHIERLPDIRIRAPHPEILTPEIVAACAPLDEADIRAWAKAARWPRAGFWDRDSGGLFWDWLRRDWHAFVWAHTICRLGNAVGVPLRRAVHGYGVLIDTRKGAIGAQGSPDRDLWFAEAFPRSAAEQINAICRDLWWRANRFEPDNRERVLADVEGL